MKILYKNENLRNPEVSIILIDWSVRHSFHILEYLNNQTIDRNNYEIIWIEYYDRKPEKIEKKLNNSIKKGKSVLDKWVILEMPREVYYHKHLMFNVGIILSEGEIICIPDSDAMVKKTFVETIIKEFKKNQNIVLHIDEIRNENKKFYPFNYPSFEEVLGEGRVLRWDGKTDIEKLDDPIHLLNYGACMCAKKEDLIKIGGADEHIDYLGHICGVYEMTFRLRNYGLKEVWLKEEFLYHTWHPGESGSFDYMGPHDGLNMSTTALNVLITKRILPLQENKSIKIIREKKLLFKTEELLKLAIPEKEIIQTWTVDVLREKEIEKILFPLDKKIRIFVIFIKTTFKKENLKKIKEIFEKDCFPFLKKLKSKKSRFLIIKFVKLVLKIFGDIYWNFYYLNKKVKSNINNISLLFYNHIIPEKNKKFFFTGKDDYTFIYIYLAKKFNINFKNLDLNQPLNFDGKFVITSYKNKEKFYKKLKKYGINDNDIILP
ncbi:MAG TPA: hypothetical protein PKV21_07980 [bacterium]|nr:hypothetical protein [bacterium]HOM27426.1 hypothetical protein [bacterium]